MRTITLCGSANFEAEFKTCMKLLTMNGAVVIGLGSYPSENDGNKDWYGETKKHLFDLVHLEKVSQADGILVIDCHVGDEPFDGDTSGYIGFSTAREILWASLQSKPAAFLSDLLAGHTSIEDAMAELVKAFDDFKTPILEIEVAETLLERALGRLQVESAQDNTKTTVMHAVLSTIAENRRPEASLDAPDVAIDALTFLGLEVLPPAQRDAYLLMVDPNSSSNRDAVGG